MNHVKKKHKSDPTDFHKKTSQKDPKWSNFVVIVDTIA